MHRTTVWLWLALGGAILQILSLGTDFYLVEGTRRDAWMGIPHASELLLLSAIVTISLFGLTAVGRNPIGGRSLGVIIGSVGAIAALQLAYRMVAPPFGGAVPDHAMIIGTSCLYYCWPSQANPADLLIGIWMALIGAAAVGLGGLAHAFTRTAEKTPPHPWIAPSQPEMNPWLGLAALGAIGQFVFGYTVFTFYRTVAESGAKTWSGWLPTPHTSSLVLAISVIVVGLVWAAVRQKSPLKPTALGAMIAVLGFIAFARIGYRIVQPPFGASGFDTIEIGLAAYIALLSAAVVLVSGGVQALVSFRQQQTVRVPGRA